MAEPLKNQFGMDVARRIGESLLAQWPAFRQDLFLQRVGEGYEPLGLMARARRIAQALRHGLPPAYSDALRLLLASLGEQPEQNAPWGGGNAMAPFFYLPHVLFVADYGLDGPEEGLADFDLSMQAQHELTRRFTAEWSIRPFLARHTARTLACLARWVHDPDAHVRRLVSEGTRPRLPWAPRLQIFQKDPLPVLALLEQLKDDPSLYVRRSVANNLNDIGKDHPDLLACTMARWSENASPERQRLIRHALRSALKRAEPQALAVSGFGQAASVVIRHAHLVPDAVPVGESIHLRFDIVNLLPSAQSVWADLCVHFVKANGQTRPKVFRLKTLRLLPKATICLEKTLCLADKSTRKHYPGTHHVELILNGHAAWRGDFVVLAP